MLIEKGLKLLDRNNKADSVRSVARINFILLGIGKYKAMIHKSFVKIKENLNIPRQQASSFSIWNMRS